MRLSDARETGIVAGYCTARRVKTIYVSQTLSHLVCLIGTEAHLWDLFQWLLEERYEREPTTIHPLAPDFPEITRFITHTLGGLFECYQFN